MAATEKPDTLTTEALEWAITHLTKFGDTDIFPVPFEYACIQASWGTLLPELLEINLTTYTPDSSVRMLVPKAAGGFRVVAQLDPIDALIYTALAYEAAVQIESRRIPADQHVACSYRVDIDSKGRLFAAESGWPEYHSRSQKLSDDKQYTHVLVADIADFYNQIYTHRVQSALELAGIDSVRANNIEKFLLLLSAKQSRGLPVGPTASILFAEAALIDVDDFLLRQGAPFTRFVDDFRVFCKSRTEAIKIQHDLTEYMYTSHRLILEWRKSQIVSTNDFKKRELINPAAIEERAQVNKLQELIEQIFSTSGYFITEDELLDEDKKKAVRENLQELFEGCIAKTPLHLGLARYLLRRATRLKTAVLIDDVLSNLDILAPAFREASLYLAACTTKGRASEVGRKIGKFIDKSDYAQLPFVKLWLIDLFQERKDILAVDKTLELSEKYKDSLGLRAAALVAQKNKRFDWLRAHKETWPNHGPWDRRAIIYAGSTLPATERRIWLDAISSGNSSSLEKAVARKAKNG